MADLTFEEHEDWLPPRNALNLVDRVYGDAGVSSRAILGRLQGGLVRAAASYCDVKSESPLLVPKSHWGFLAMGGKPDWWDTGDVKVFIAKLSTRQGFNGRYFDVRFEPIGIQAMIGDKPLRKKVSLAKISDTPAQAPATAVQPPIEAKVTSPVARRSPVGRPPKDLWEDMLIAATKAIWYDAILQPKTQADVQRWMAAWAIENGHEHPGETALKERARKVFLAYQDEGRK